MACFGCGAMLKHLRLKIKESKVTVPPYGGTTRYGEQLFTVYLGNEPYEVNSCCAKYARYMAISEYLSDNNITLKGEEEFQEK